ncbi:unnamed protein product, partial [Pylaiella littoralis]
AQPPIHKSNNENTTNKHNYKVSEHAICERTAQGRSGEHLNERAQHAGKRVPSFAILLPLLLLPLLLPLVCCCVLPPVDGPCSKKSCSTQNPVGVMATSGEDAGSHRQHLLPSEPPPPQHGANVIYRLSSKQVTKEEEEEQEKEEEDSKAKYLPLTQKDVANGVMGEKDAVEAPTLLAQATAALSYAVASLMVIFVNKLVLTTKEFPSFFFIAISQFTSTCLVLSLLNVTGHIKIARLDRSTAKAMVPLMVLFLGNTVSGLGGTKHINLPMFTVLRRFSILMTMVMEKYILKSGISWLVQLSVAMMIGGALVAAIFDLQFEPKGYLLVATNDFCTAALGIAVKRALNLKIPQMSLLYYNSLFGAAVMTLVALNVPGESERIVNFSGWADPTFVGLYLCTSFMGTF